MLQPAPILHEGMFAKALYVACSRRNLTQIDGRATVNPQDLSVKRAPKILQFKRKTERVYPPNLSKAYLLKLWGYLMSLSLE
jgi:hypothetical protein